MKCTNCAKLVPDAANYCGYCGHQLKNVPQPPQVAALQRHSKKSKADDGILIERTLKIIAIVLMVAAAGYSLYAAMLGILNVDVYQPTSQHVLNLLPSITIVGMIFLARKQPIIAAAALIALAVPNFSNYLFSISLIVGAFLLAGPGVLKLIQSNN